jgi:hypothetical protein
MAQPLAIRDLLRHKTGKFDETLLCSRCEFIVPAHVFLDSHLWTTRQTDVETRAREASQALIKGHVAWKTKLSSPGVSIQAKQTGRQGSIVSYSLFVSGLPSDEVYTYMSWPVGEAKSSPVMHGVTIGKDGVLMCAGRTPEQCGDPSKKDDIIDFTFNPAKGEPYRPALVAGDHRVAFVIAPDPIFAKDKGCTLSVERLLPHFELAYFTGTGFPPNSDVSFDGQSYGENIR